MYSVQCMSWSKRRDRERNSIPALAMLCFFQQFFFFFLNNLKAQVSGVVVKHVAVGWSRLTLKLAGREPCSTISLSFDLLICKMAQSCLSRLLKRQKWDNVWIRCHSEKLILISSSLHSSLQWRVFPVWVQANGSGSVRQGGEPSRGLWCSSFSEHLHLKKASSEETKKLCKGYFRHLEWKKITLGEMHEFLERFWRSGANLGLHSSLHLHICST